MLRARAILAGVAVVLAAAPGAFGFWIAPRVVDRLAGSGTPLAAAEATISGSIVAGSMTGGHFTATVATRWSAATTRRSIGILTCAPATGTLVLRLKTDVSLSLTGQTCRRSSRSGTSYSFAGSQTAGRLHLSLTQRGAAVTGTVLLLAARVPPTGGLQPS